MTKQKGKAPAFQFYVRDWLGDPQLKMTSHQSKGIWVDILCYMWDAPERGRLTGSVGALKRLVGCSWSEFNQFLVEADVNKFCDIDKGSEISFPVDVTKCNPIVTITNRRMFRDFKFKENNRLRVQRYRLKSECNPNVIRLSSSSTSNTSENSQNSAEFRLAKMLFDEIKKRNPNHKKPNLQTWAKHVEKMIRIDKRTPEQIKAVIIWSQKNEFWQNNILSTNKLREKYDQLILKMGKNGTGFVEHKKPKPNDVEILYRAYEVLTSQGKESFDSFCRANKITASDADTVLFKLEREKNGIENPFT